jgi:hypothetical protein
MAPFHSGAVRYFKEIGIWKPDFEAANQKKLESRAAWKARWDKFLEDVEQQERATKKKVNIKDEWTKIMTKEFGFVLPKGF